MNITRYNYQRAVPLLIRTIKQCDYLAIDFEFSGLQQDFQDLANHQSDSVEQRYWKHRTNVQKFMPLQIGICAFKYSNLTQTLTCQPFNFYILPHSKTDKLLTAQLSSLQFLAENKFDFNKLFYESVQYMSMEEYGKYIHIKGKRGLKKEQESLPFNFNDPECILFCNSKFDQI